MKLFSKYGCTDFVLALGLGGDQIREYFINSFELLHDIEINIANNEIKSLNKIPEENWTIKLVDTGISASTGARIARCERYLKYEPFFIAYSDVLADVRINELVDFHVASGKMLTVTGVHPPSRFGTFFLDEHNVMSYDAHAKLEMKQSRINGGFMVANEKIFEKLSPISECNLESEIFDVLIKENNLALWKHDGFWQNVDTERDIEHMQGLYDINKRPWLGIN